MWKWGYLLTFPNWTQSNIYVSVLPSTSPCFNSLLLTETVKNKWKFKEEVSCPIRNATCSAVAKRHGHYLLWSEVEALRYRILLINVWDVLKAWEQEWPLLLGTRDQHDQTTEIRDSYNLVQCNIASQDLVDMDMLENVVDKSAFLGLEIVSPSDIRTDY